MGGADVGDCVVVVNAEKVIVTGNKATQKFYRRHSGRPGGMKSELFKDLQARIPERIVEKRNSLNQSPLEDSLPRQIHKFLCFSTQMQSNALDEMGKHRTFIPDNWPRCDIHAGEKVRRTSDYLL